MIGWYKKFTFIIIFSLLLTGCTSEKYKEYMSNGQKAKLEGNFEVAVRYFNEALKEEPNDTAAKKALEETNKLIKESKEIKRLLDAGHQALLNEKYQDAITTFKKVIEFKVTDVANQKYIDQARESLTKAENLLAEQKELAVINALAEEIKKSDVESSSDTANTLMQKAQSIKPKTESAKLALKELTEILSDTLEYHEILKKIEASTREMEYGSFEKAYNMMVEVTKMKPTGETAKMLVEESKRALEELDVELARIKADNYSE